MFLYMSHTFFLYHDIKIFSPTLNSKIDEKKNTIKVHQN